MNNKIIKMPGVSASKACDGVSGNHEAARVAVDVSTEEGKLVLENYFTGDSFYIMKCIEGLSENIPSDTIFQFFHEFWEYLSQFDEKILYDCEGRLYLNVNNGKILYEIRRVTFKGETYLERKSYHTNQPVIDTVWKTEGYTEAPFLALQIKEIKSQLFYQSEKEGLIYSHLARTHEIVESYADKRDDGYYKVGGRSRMFEGSVFAGEEGMLVECSLQSLFNKGLIIVKNCANNSFMLMRNYSQLSRLWEKTGYIEVYDRNGDLVLNCSDDKQMSYMVRKVTRQGENYLESGRPGKELLESVWEKTNLTNKVYPEMKDDLSY